MKQEKEKELWGNCDIEKDMSWNMYQILVNTAVSANLIGTICNLYSWDGTTHHTLRSMPVDDPDHRMCRMDYPKGAITCGCDHFNTFLV